MNARILFFIVGLFATVFMSGCMLFKDDPPPRAQISSDKVRLADDISLAQGNWPEPKWWMRFDDPQLDALIEKAQEDSPALAAARDIIAAAEAQIDLLRGGFAPQIEAIGMINREKASEMGFLGPYAKNYPKLGLTGPWYTGATVGLTGSFSIDLWGKRRSNLAAVVGKRNARAAEAAVVELAITSEIAQLYYSMQTGYAMLDLLKQTSEVLEFAVEAHKGRADTGLDAKTAIHGARAQLLGVRRQIVAAQGQLLQAREAIRALVGAGVDDMPEINPVPLPAVSMGMPEALSYELLARRPDLQAMRWFVQASLSEIDAAKAAFYPSFDIKAFFGLDTIHISNLFNSGSQQINLIPGFYLPIFNGGALRANLSGARAVNNQLVEEYNQAVLNAVRDVALSGSMLQTLIEERQLQADKVRAASIAQESAEAHQQRGLVARTVSMEARLPVIAERASLLLIDGQLIAQEISLIKALGGGYDAEMHVKPDSN